MQFIHLVAIVAYFCYSSVSTYLTHIFTFTMTTSHDNTNNSSMFPSLSPKLAFLLVSFFLGQLGDGLNIFQGIYLVRSMNWNEGSVGAALSLMGLTALIVQPFAGDWVDKATVHRRVFLVVASLVTAMSASTILHVHKQNIGEYLLQDHVLIYASKVTEGIASSFIGPCLAALTLASFGPHQFDAVMASNLFWGHVGSVVAAVLAGFVAYMSYPDIKYCFLVIGASALVAVAVVPSLPEGDPRMGRGFAAAVETKKEETSFLESATTTHNKTNSTTIVRSNSPVSVSETSKLIESKSDLKDTNNNDDDEPTASSYLEVFLDSKTCILSLTGFFFHFANANVLLVLGELMGGGDADESTRSVIPLTAGAIVTAQFTMAIATWVGASLTDKGAGRKPLFMACLMTLPLRCAMIIWLLSSGHEHLLLSTQIFDGIGGGLFALIHPYLVADITFGTGRFNVVSKYYSILL